MKVRSARLWSNENHYTLRCAIDSLAGAGTVDLVAHHTDWFFLFCLRFFFFPNYFERKKQEKKIGRWFHLRVFFALGFCSPHFATFIEMAHRIYVRMWSGADTQGQSTGGNLVRCCWCCSNTIERVRIQSEMHAARLRHCRCNSGNILSCADCSCTTPCAFWCCTDRHTVHSMQLFLSVSVCHLCTAAWKKIIHRSYVMYNRRLVRLSIRDHSSSNAIHLAQIMCLYCYSFLSTWGRAVLGVHPFMNCAMAGVENRRRRRRRKCQWFGEWEKTNHTHTIIDTHAHDTRVLIAIVIIIVQFESDAIINSVFFFYSRIHESIERAIHTLDSVLFIRVAVTALDH